ncbi:nitrilase and fragile histidine triad fusion protein NitFhit-like isoform X2 [Watersipora subatra]|uniref:nitrilase and fragile histidine triad fusion protein NitFhit-like isoform X2 n=1 Tax=Watersipora subatra TaxID=2589382 RepID=UPI00355AF424
MRRLIWNHLLLTNNYKASSTFCKVFRKAMTTRKTKVAVCQMCSTEDKEANLQQGRELIEKCKRQEAEVVFLPEGFDCIETSKEAGIVAGESVEGPTISAYCSIAKANNLWLSLGGFKEKSAGGNKVFNTHILVDPQGIVVGKYSKLHLFDVDIPEKIRLCESDFTLPGRMIAKPVPTPAGNIGLSICYDLRFPELSTILRNGGADILTYPSAFTVATGKAHWEVLLRAKAIENQCYVVAAAQVGQHNPKRASHGHSMIIDPWGKILCDIEDGVGVATAEIDLDLIEKVRTSMPVLSHKRPDLYTVSKCNNNQSYNIDERKVYNFAQLSIPYTTVIYRTQLSFAFVNKKPVLPGHMLVSPIRVVKRMADLTFAEMADLFESVSTVSEAVKKEFAAESLTVTIQDGPDAGQTVEHVHVHILPRRPGDFENNDDIYGKLESHDKQEDGTALPQGSHLWRTEDVMMEEASRMRKYFI